MVEYRRKKKEFVCPFCGADFNTKRQLKSHLNDKCKKRSVKNG